MQSDSVAGGKTEPTELDLEVQIVRNTIYNLELEEAEQGLRSQSIVWLSVACLGISLAAGLGFVAFAVFRLPAALIETDIKLTIVTTMLTLVLVGAVASLTRYLTLRRLTSDVRRIIRLNLHLIMDARHSVGNSH